MDDAGREREREKTERDLLPENKSVRSGGVKMTIFKLLWGPWRDQRGGGLVRWACLIRLSELDDDAAATEFFNLKFRRVNFQRALSGVSFRKQNESLIVREVEE